MSLDFSKIKNINIPVDGTDEDVVQVARDSTILWRKQFTVTWRFLSAYPNTWTTATENYYYGDTPSRAAAATVTSGNGQKVFAQWDNLSVITSDRTINATYTEQFYATITPNYCTANRTTGWYNSGTVITWTANDNYSFNGSAVKDTTTSTITSGTTYTKSPSYVKCTISGTNCSANKTSGTILAVGTTITWTGTIGTNYKYGFGSGATWSNSYATTTQDVALGTTSYSKNASNIWYNVTITKNTGTASSNYSSGYLLNGTTVTFTATANTSTVKYSYSNSSADTHTTSYTVSSAGQSISSPTVYNWYYVKISATNSTAHKGSATGTVITSGSSAWYINGQTITWTPATNYSFLEGTSQTNTTASISNANALSKSPSYGYVTVSKTRCTGIDTGYRAIGDTTFTANTNCAYSADGTTTTQTKTVAAGGTISSSADYIYVKVSGTNCTANKSTGWFAYNTQCTWTASTSYAFDNSGTTTSTANFTSPGSTYTKTPGYAYLTVTGSHRSVTANDAGWYTAGSSVTTTFKADSGWSFGGTTAQDTTTKTVTVPGTNSATPTYFYVTIQATNSSANKSTGWYNASFTCTWTANTNYAFDNAGTATSGQTISIPGTYSKSPGYGKYTVTATNSTASVSTGWYAVTSSKSTTFTANSGWSFGGETAQDTTSKSAAVPGSVSASPAYFYLTISAGTGCTVNKESGFYTAAQTITWTRTTGYAFDSSGTTTASQTTSAAPGSYNKAATHGYYTLSLTNCAYNSGNNAGWYTLGTKPSTTVKANSGWSFGGSTAQDTKSIGGTNAVPTTASASPSYFYITVSAGTGCSANQSSGFYTSSTKPASITWTPTTYYSFATGTTQTSYTNSSISSAPATYTATPTNYKLASCTANYCSAKVGSATGSAVSTSTYYASGSKIYWVADSTHSFAGSAVSDTRSGTTDITAGGTPSMAPGYTKCTISGTNCTFSPASNSILKNGNDGKTPAATITWTANTGYHFNDDQTKTTDTATVTAATTSYSKTANINSYVVTITATNCKATYLSTSSTATSGDPSGTSYNYQTTVYGFATLKDDTAEYTYTAPSDWTQISGRTYRVGQKVVATSGNSISVSANVEKVQYTITWRYRTAYNTWSDVQTIYYYGDTPGTTTPVSGTVPTPSSVTSGNAGYRPQTEAVGGVWGIISTVTGNKTYTAQYVLQYKVTSLTQTYTNAYTDNTYTTAFTTGWYDSGTDIYWKAKTNYYYDGSGTTTSTTDVTSGTNTNNPTHLKWSADTYNYCTPSPASGSIVAVGSNITWTASSGYSFAEGTTQTSTSTSAVVLWTLSYAKTPGYRYVSINNTHCGSTISTGYRAYPQTITWTPSTGTNYKYSFTNTVGYDPTDAQRKTTESFTATGTNSFTKSPAYIYYNTQFYYEYDSWLSEYDGDEIVSDPGSGQYVNEWHYLLGGSSVEFSSKANDNNIHCAFSEDDPLDLIYTYTINSAGMQINDNMSYYIFYHCTFSGANTNASSQTNWYQWGDIVTITANSSTTYKYSFSNTDPITPETTKDHKVTKYGSFTYNASYTYYKVTINTSSTGPTNYQSLFAASSSSATSGTTVGTGTQWILKNYYLRAQAIADPDSYDKYNFSNSPDSATDSATKWTTSSQITTSTTWNIPTMYKWIYITSYSNPSHGHAEPENWRPWLHTWVVCSSWSSVDGWSYPVELQGISHWGYYAVFDSYNGSTTKTEYVKTGGNITWTSIAKWKADVAVSAYQGRKTRYQIYTPQFEDSYRSQVRTQVQYATDTAQTSWSAYNRFTNMSGSSTGNYVYWPNYTDGSVPYWTESSLKYIRCRTTLLVSASASDLWAQPSGVYSYFTLDPATS